MQNNRTVFKTCLKQCTHKNFFSSECKKGWYEKFARQTKSAVIRGYGNSFSLDLISSHPRVYEFFYFTLGHRSF